MPRGTSKPDDLEAITARRTALVAELAAVDEKLKAAESAARDAGRSTLFTALGKVKIAALDKAEAKAIAIAIDKFGGTAVAAHLASLQAN